MPEVDERGTDDRQDRGLWDRAICLDFRTSILGTRRKVSTDRVDVGDADPKMIHVTKDILRSDMLKKITRVITDAQSMLRLKAIPTPQLRRGTYAIPIAAVTVVNEGLKEKETEFLSLIDQFCDPDSEDAGSYVQVCKAADKALGRLYDAAQYPSIAEVRDAFGFVWAYVDFSVPGRLRKIDMEIFKNEEEKAAEQWKSALDEARMFLRATMKELVDHMSDRLTIGEDGKPKIFRDSLVNNLTDFLNNFDIRNITDDSELSSVVGDMRELLAGVNPDKLRKNEELRNQTKVSVDQIKKQLDVMVADRPKRRLRFNAAEKPESESGSGNNEGSSSDGNKQEPVEQAQPA